MILTGVFANKKINPAGNDGLIYGGTNFFLHQVLGCLIVVVFATVVGFILFKVVDLIHPMRVTELEEETGLDITQHAESL
jgi:Amt family ammonium transporter